MDLSRPSASNVLIRNRFPNEIWNAIAAELGFPNRNLVHPLLLVCRDLYDLAIPLIYEYIQVVERQYTTSGCAYASTKVYWSSVDRLLQTYLNDPQLAAKTDTFTVRSQERYFEGLVKSLRSILPCLSNLRRLAISPVLGDFKILRLVPPSAPLTHLTLMGSDDAVYAEEIMQSHSNALAFLRMSRHYYFPCRPVFVTPRLVSLEGTMKVFDNRFLSQTSRIEHLSFQYGDEVFPENAFSNLRTLEVEVRDEKGLTRIAPFLTKVELYSCVFWNSIFLSRPDLLMIPSKHLKYLRFWGIGNAQQPSYAELFFNNAMSLKVIDFVPLTPDITVRFTRGKEDPVIMVTPRSDSLFISWWEPLLDGLVKEG
ncbi:hypothetical protein ONZ45_g12550 [Pleurotus djamor]|nr:hypothetical protein ONZ45_g12550 [Pleurotus djamor]